MTDVTIEAGTLTANRQDRVVSGLLLPYGERCRSNLGRFAVPRGAFEVPADVTVLNANVGHDREQPVARFTTVNDTAAGLYAAFKVADGPEGDALLDEIDAGKRNALSVEAKGVAIRSGKAIAGKVFGAAFVKAGAFPSATLMAEDVGDLPDDLPPDTDSQSETTDVIDVNGVQYQRVTTSTYQTETTALDDSDETDTQEDTVPDTLEATSTPATVPGSIKAAPKAKASATLFARLADKDADKRTLLAALDQAISTDLLPTQQQQWLGEVYSSKTYVRKFATLVQHADLQGLQAIGWRFIAGKTPAVAAYSGFPAQPNSNEVKTESVTLSAARLAGAGSVDRAFIDFPTPEFWAGYFREVTNDYERKLDAIARDALISGATACTASAVPSGVATAASYLVDGVSQILDAERGMPTFALVGTALWKQLALVREDDVLGYLQALLGIDVPSFPIIPTSVATLTGKVLVGCREAATVFELPGASPVRVDAVNIAQGGVDQGVYGYHAELINDASSLALVAAAG